MDKGDAVEALTTMADAIAVMLAAGVTPSLRVGPREAMAILHAIDALRVPAAERLSLLAGAMQIRAYASEYRPDWAVTKEAVLEWADEIRAAINADTPTPESAPPVPTRDAAVEACARAIEELSREGGYAFLSDPTARAEQISAILRECGAFTAAVEGWRPIESAPKDGTTRIMAGWPDFSGIYVVRWHLGMHEWIDAAYDEPFTEPPTHWMPLPEPPK